MATDFKVGVIVDAQVTRITDFGAFIQINGRRNIGLIHISQVASSFVKDINEHLKVGDRVKARVIKIGPGKRVDLSLKPADTNTQKNNAKFKPAFKSSDFEDKLKKFLKDSQQSLADLKKHNDKFHR